MDVLGNQVNFRSLSLRDLLDARDAYHWQLMNKANVVGTAIGLYLIRKTDSWPEHEAVTGKIKGTGPRTFENSEVRPYSWPCILVLVTDWVNSVNFGGDGIDANHMVPSTLYLPDGRAAPVCVVQVDPRTSTATSTDRIRWPDSYIGSGCPLYAHVQGIDHTASVGCLVTDGHKTYALTNRHVTGEAGTPISGDRRGNVAQVGIASPKQLTRLPFATAFPASPGVRTYLTLDIGLVDVKVASDWTSRPFGIPGQVEAVADVNEGNLGLQLIDQPVVAFGAMSGALSGVIKALFYRHKALAGFDYVSEFLIAPDDGATQTCPGDSGTVWYLTDHTMPAATRPLRPIAIEWGGQTVLTANGGRMAFSLATGLSTACQLLDLDIVREHDTGATPFWGQTGHYSIATAAIGAVTDPDLSAFLEANIDRISFKPGDLSPAQIRAALQAGDFYELADVPDVVWKKVKGKIPGGRDYAQNAGPEHPNHYADIDQPDTAGGPNLRDLTLADISKMDPAAWSAWYATNGSTDTRHQGLLPFRVWQLFDVMVAALQANDIPHFLCAAGVVSHYVGDACQPLHGSYHSDGYPEQAAPGAKKWPGKGVHSAYEDKMVDTFSAQLLGQIGPAAAAFTQPIHAVRDGRDAGYATVELMGYASSVIAPTELCDVYIGLGGGTSKPIIAGLWDKFGDRTATVMGAGAHYLAAIWEAAFVAGGKPALGGAVDKPLLASIYQDAAFAPSLTLDKIATVLVASGTAAAAAA